MLQVPVLFILSLLMIVALVRYSAFSDRRIGWLARAALATMAVESMLNGLRWSYGFPIPWNAQAVTAAAIPPLLWLSLNGMVSGADEQRRAGLWRHLACPPLMIVAALLWWPDAVDILLGLLFLGYGSALLYASFRDEREWLERIPFQSWLSTRMVFRATGATLIFCAAIDSAIAFDLVRNGGALAPDIIGGASLAIILALFGAIATIGRLAPEWEIAAEPVATLGEEGPAPAAPAVTDAEMQALYAATLQRLDGLMMASRLYREPNLSLNRMARRLGVPSRQISAAINGQRAMNVPQYVNMFRVMEACQRLHDPSIQITEVIFEVGFQTKSNFNREFQRIVGMSPSDWRQRKATPALPAESLPEESLPEESLPEAVQSFLAHLSSKDLGVPDREMGRPETG